MKVNLSKYYSCYFPDLLLAFTKVIQKYYSLSDLRGARRRFLSFLYHPLNFSFVPTGLSGRGESTIIGEVNIRGLSATFVVGANAEPSIGVYNLKNKDKPQIEKILEEIENYLKNKSIYKGQAITSSGEFIDLSGVSIDKIVYNKKVLEDIKTHVWTIIEETERCLEAGVKLQRKILFRGPVGSGKTLTAYLTAQKAVKNGWTFIYYDSSQNKRLGQVLVGYVLRLAKIYEPAVLVIEDIENEQGNNDITLGSLLINFDGILSKSSKVIVVMTTNKLKEIDGRMLRPGRIDKIIDFGIFRAENIETLIKTAIPPQLIDKNIDWEKVKNACVDYSPAFVKEVADSARLAAIRESGEKKIPVRVTEEKLIAAAEDLKYQYEMAREVVIGFNP